MQISKYNMQIKGLMIAAALAVCTQAVCQNDTIAYPYPYYFPPFTDIFEYINTDYIPGYCVTDVVSDFLTADILGIQVPHNIVLSSEIYIGSVAERDMEIIGVAMPVIDRQSWNSLWFRDDSSICPYSLRVAIPGNGTVVNIAEVPPHYLQDLVANKWIMGFYHHTDFPRYLYGGVMEVMFDTAYHLNVGDTIYMSYGKMCPSRDNPDIMVYGQQDHLFYEMHNGMVATSDWHTPELLFAGDFGGEWMQGTFHGEQLMWLIVRYDSDTCPAPRGLTATPLAEGTEFLQFDTMGNHAVWQVTYGPAGTLPDDCTVVQTTMPQAVVGNLDPSQRYVAYCRARCDFAVSEWSPWSDSTGFTPTAVGIADVAHPQLTLSPNPAHGKTSINCSHAIQCLLVVTVDGKTVLDLHPDATEAIIDLHHLSPGTYTVVAITTEGIATRALMVW